MSNNPRNSLYDLFMNVAPATVMFFIIIILALIIYIAYIIRLWTVQTAILQMQKDLMDIKSHLLGTQSEGSIYVDQPNLSNYLSEDEKKAGEAEKLARLKPRRAFIWLAITAPVLLIVFVVMKIVI